MLYNCFNNKWRILIMNQTHLDSSMGGLEQAMNALSLSQTNQLINASFGKQFKLQVVEYVVHLPSGGVEMVLPDPGNRQ